MKSVHHGTAAANCKLKGKLTQRLICGCCDLYNWKWQEKVKLANQDIRYYRENRNVID
jgi:hypothetical protein